MANQNPLGVQQQPRTAEKAREGATASAAEGEKPAAVPAEKRYVVQSDFDVPAHSSSYRLKKGQIISSMGHNIAELKRLGVPLRELE